MKDNKSNDWSLGDESLGIIIERLGRIKPKLILEYGSGVSSIRLAKSFPAARIISIESEIFYHAETERERENAEAGNLKVIHCPLQYQWHGFCRYLSYSKPYFEGEIDCILIDGPPGRILRGREACLYGFYEKLKTGGLVILDDYKREGEKQAVKNWIRSYPGSFRLEEIESEHHLAVLTKIKPVRGIRFSLERIWDNIRVNKYYICSDLKKAATPDRKKLLSERQGPFS